ncbi:hypothetical protein I6N90_17025 [Paenibacillus sp. GSMTC-2017]|uniref:hypothetical protein n=1 Tax=Paenibacillus sp. GSMTC-2017 TaxID=2794350 RepID=UPI0018D9BC52|nr:hypothetical protein [Paenibacillus sp. GSMTC-2017]MBH5319501.1 hypothetical protein [Paenibacillus sp. GSMTC-2017]
MDTIYVHVRHWLFWYGVYGFTDKSCNDEITLYSDKEKNNFVAYFELSTKLSLINLLKYDLDIIGDEQEYINEIENFLNSKKEFDFSYIYPRDEEDLSDQVEHFAPTNEKGHKPTYIDMWTKLSERWDVAEIEKTVKLLANHFLQVDVKNVEFLEIPTYEETKLCYEEYYAPYI